MKKFLIGTVILIVIIILAFAGINLRDTLKLSACTSSTAVKMLDQTSVTIISKNYSFTPSCLLVKSGTKIIWDNQGSKTIDIGADPHPIHTGNREVYGGQFVLSIKPNQTAAVTITKLGKSGYHDHLNFTSHGVIIVQ